MLTNPYRLGCLVTIYVLSYDNQLCFKRAYCVLQNGKMTEHCFKRLKIVHTVFNCRLPMLSFFQTVNTFYQQTHLFVYLYGILTLLWYRFSFFLVFFFFGGVGLYTFWIYSHDSSPKLKKWHGTKERDHVTGVTDFHNNMQPTVYEKIGQVFTLDTCHF